jgi:hypothetical protein
MSETSVQWLSLDDVAARLDCPPARVRQLLRDRQLVAVSRDGRRVVPAAFLHDGAVLKGLPGVLTVLADGGYSDEEAVDWLLRSDDSLPGAPVEALADNRGREVRRRAQALAF